jgi:uncharacterized cofD-like protein
MIILGPGDLFTSVLSDLIVDDISSEIQKSKAKKVYVMNLMTKYGQTYKFKASNHIDWLEKFIGKSLDYVLINNAPLSKTGLSIYKKSNEFPVEDDLGKTKKPIIIRADLVSNQIIKKPKTDELVRSLIRHDSDKIALIFHKIVSGEL